RSGSTSSTVSSTIGSTAVESRRSIRGQAIRGQTRGRLWSLPTTISQGQIPRLCPRQISLKKVRNQSIERHRLSIGSSPYKSPLSYYLSTEEYSLYVFIRY